jgi:predicted transposase YdaD
VIIIFERTEKPMTELISVFEEKALAKGREQGRQEDRQEGRLKGRRGAILTALEVRFGEVPSEVRTKIEALRNEEALTRTHRLAITAPNLQSFLDQL